MDLLACSEEMMPETPDGVIQGPDNMSEILRQRQLSVDMKFSNEVPGPLAKLDPVLLNDSRVLEELLKLEEKFSSEFTPVKDFGEYNKEEIKLEERSDMICWLYEVCDEEKYPLTTFLRAVSYIDRVLSVHIIKRNQLQLLGIVCLSLSLKFTGVHFKIAKLIYYTADSVPKGMIRDWELLALFSLKWDMNIPVAADFLQIYETLLPNKSCLSEQVKTVMSDLSALCAADYSFIIHTQSTLALAILTLALREHVSGEVSAEALEILHQHINVEKNTIYDLIEKILLRLDQLRQVAAAAAESNAKLLESQSQNETGNNNNNNDVMINKHDLSYENDNQMEMEVEDADVTLTPSGSAKLEELAKAETPTDEVGPCKRLRLT